jgi:hypothetical protein
MRVANKREFFELWEAGVLGNRTRLWRNPEEAVKWAHQMEWARSFQSPSFGDEITGEWPEIGFREIRKPGSTGAGAWCKVPWWKVLDTAAEWQAAGRDFIMDDGAPDEYRTLQGEVCRTFRGMEGYLTMAKLPMRQAFAQNLARHFSYLETRMALDRYMDPSSRDDLDALLERYPDAAVEFTCFSVNVGVIPYRNTLFWETRDY